MVAAFSSLVQGEVTFVVDMAGMWIFFAISAMGYCNIINKRN